MLRFFFRFSRSRRDGRFKAKLQDAKITWDMTTGTESYGRFSLGLSQLVPFKPIRCIWVHVE